MLSPIYARTQLKVARSTAELTTIRGRYRKYPQAWPGSRGGNHDLHLLLLVQSFILNLRLGFSANPFLHRPFPFLPDCVHGPSNHLMCLYSAQRLDLFAWCVRLSRLLSRYSNALKIIALSFHFTSVHPQCQKHIYHSAGCRSYYYTYYTPCPEKKVPLDFWP